jgi:hypothetical protein
MFVPTWQRSNSISGVRELETRKPMLSTFNPDACYLVSKRQLSAQQLAHCLLQTSRCWVSCAQTSVLWESSFRTRDTAVVCWCEIARLVEKKSKDSRLGERDLSRRIKDRKWAVAHGLGRRRFEVGGAR